MEELLNIINISYILSILGSTELITWYWSIKEAHKARLITIASGIVLGVSFFYLGDVSFSQILASFFVSIGFYAIIVKAIKNKYFPK